MKNLVILHLESISWQRVTTFPSAFPNLRRFFRGSRVYDWFISSATSSRMAITYLFHANDFEFDLSSHFSSARPIINNPDLFSVLRERGYSTDIICLDTAPPNKVHLALHSGVLPPVWTTKELPEFFEKFDDLTDTSPFAIYVWNLLTHIERSQRLASLASGLTDQVARACAIADDTLGKLLVVLEQKNLLQDTTIVVFGDHGDNQWTHGFKGGLIHGTEPYTEIVHVPLAIRDPDLQNGNDNRIASTVDIAPTCLQLLGIEAALSFRESGQTLLKGEREFAFSQNFTARQRDVPHWDTRNAFSVTDHTYTLLVSSRGLEFYAHRLDPGNHCNLLHFFNIDNAGRLVFDAPKLAHEHFRSAMENNPRALNCMSNDFQRLREALLTRILSKRSFIIERNADPAQALNPNCCNVINRDGRDRFFAGRTKWSLSFLLFRRLAGRVLRTFGLR